MKIVFLYSGGLDSVGALWHLLTTTNDNIYVQHINIDCYWHHWEAEKIASDNTLQYMKEHCRDFIILPDVNYAVSSIPMYSSVCVFFGAMALLELQADRLYTANIKGDDDDRSLIWWDKFTQPIFSGMMNNHVAIHERPFMKFTKSDWIKEIPKELQELSFSCRHPIKINGIWKQCDMCISCWQRIESMNGLKTIDRKPTIVNAPVLFNCDKTRTIIMLSEFNDGMRQLYRVLATTDDKVAIQFVDIKNSKTSYVKNTTEKILQLQRTYDIIRLTDVTIDSWFDSDKNHLVAFFGFCSAVKQYDWQFDRLLTGDFYVDDYERLDKIYQIKVTKPMWEDNKISCITDVTTNRKITYSEFDKLVDNYSFNKYEIKKGLVYIKCDDLIDSVVKMAAATKQGLVFFVIAANNTSYITEDAISTINQKFKKKCDAYQIAMTSGTTSKAKFIYSTKKERMLHSEFVIQRTKLTSSDIIYNIRNEGNGAWVNVVRHALTARASLLLGGADLSIEQSLDIIDKEKPTVVFSTPPSLSRFARSELMMDNEYIRLWYVSGSPINPPDAIEIDNKLKNGVVIQACSRAESNVPFMSNLYDSIDKRIFTIGYPPNSTVSKVVDGELYIKNKYISSLLTPRQNLFDEWHNTGDLIEVDSDGYYKFKGRTGLLISSGAIDLNPLEIETLIDSMDGIEKCYCVGVNLKEIPNTQIPCLVVKGKKIKHSVIMELLFKKLAVTLHQVVEIKDFPMTLSGKIDRLELTKIIQSMV